jgi:division protein CdvB (Snf7/Vps24/ESCRT-III family)
LSVSLKGEGTTFNDFASLVRLNNFIKKLGADLDQVELFISNIDKSEDPQKLFDTAKQIAQITTIPLDTIADHVKRQQDELQKPKEEIGKADAILEQKNGEIQAIQEYKKLKEELQKCGFSMESPRKLVFGFVED